MSEVCVIASPFGCDWIQRGSEGHIAGVGYAMCVRVRHHPRVVSEMECAHCALWEGSPDTSRPQSDDRHAAELSPLGRTREPRAES